jgi:MFS family permease
MQIGSQPHGADETARAAAVSSIPQPRAWRVGTLTYTARGLAALFFLLLFGDFAYSMRDRAIWPIVQIMLHRLHASDTVMAFMISALPTTLTMVISPIVSYRSDRFRSRWGRRIPFLLIPTPICAAAMIGISYTDEMGAGLRHLLGLRAASADNCALVCFGMFWTAFEVAAVIAGSVLGGLVNDVVPRELLGRFYGLFRQVSLGAGIIFNYWIIAQAEAHFRAILIGIGITFFLGFTIMCLTVREGTYPPPDDTSDRPGFWVAALRYFRECFGLPYYQRVFLGMALAAAAFTPVNLFALIYAMQLKVSMHVYGHLLAFSYFISFFLASPLGWLVDRAHTLRVTIGTVLIYSASMILLGYTIHNTWTFGVALVLHTVLSGCYWTVSSPLGQALFPRITFAQFYSAAQIVLSIVTIMFGPALGWMLDLTRHNYRLIFFAGGIVGFVSVALLAIVHRDFMKLGGPKNYTAPGEAIELAPVHLASARSS